MTNRIVWFDLPVIDFKRAMAFYTAVLDVKIEEAYPGVGVISHDHEGVSGCLFKSDEHIPSKAGVLIYFNVLGRLEAAVEAVVENGGEVEKPPHPIGTFGRRAVVIDSEGNRVALHSD